MKVTALPRRLSVSLFMFVGFIAASQSALAAAPKADSRATALVAALQAVSPDPLGGRLGLAALTEQPAMTTKRTSSRSVAAANSSTDGDQRAYLAWKSAQKS
jgi:hypothetical protein